VSASGRHRLAAAAPYAAVPLLVVLFHLRAAAPGQAFVGHDLRNFFFAVREATAAALRAGHLPGWQRGIFLGYPLVADPQAAVLDPATWLTLPWDAPRALTLAALLHLCAAGWGMVFWLRLRGLSRAAALLGAVLFALGAKETVHLQHWNFAASTAWWPWMLAGLDGFATLGRGRFLALTAAAAALSWLGGAAQMAYFGTLVAGGYALTLAPGLWRRRRSDALLALAAAPLGLLLAAPIALPVAELAALGPRGAGIDYRFATSWKWPDRWGLALLILPRAYGGSAWMVEEMNLWEATGYLGILPLGLAAAAPLGRRGLWLFLAFAALGVWLSFGEDAWLGLHHAFYRFLPGYGSFRNPTRSLMVTSFASALLAAEGLDALRDRFARRWARAAAALAAAIALAAALPRFASFSLDRALARQGAATAIALAAAGLAWLAAGRRAGAGPRWRGTAWGLAAVLLAFADLHLAFGDMNPVAPAGGEGPRLADLAPLVPPAPSPRRVAVIAKWGRTANAALRNGWEGATGYGPTVIQRVRALLEATRSGRLAPRAKVASDTNFPRPVPTSPLWPLLAAPLVVADEPLLLPWAGEARREWEDPLVAYRAPALPRVFWVGTWAPASDDDVPGALAAAAAGDRALLAPDAPRAALPAPGAPEGPVAAERIAVDGGRIEAELSAPRPGLAVVLDPWFPGWSATVDGAPAPIARADYAFMAVPVPAGRHALRLEYRNAQVARGAAVALATAVLLAAVLVWRRRSSNPSP
jgi:hypothetical protein